MRTEFREQMLALGSHMAQMCGLAGVAMERATRALLETDLSLAEQVIDEHEQIAAMCSQVEGTAFKLIALQQPVATDLRAIICSIHNVADIDRMAALAVHVAKIVRMRHPDSALPDDVKGYFSEMGRIAVEIARSAQQVLLHPDPHKAARLHDEDFAMDDLLRRLFTALLDRDWQSGTAAAVDVALLGRFYERFADHAVEIGRRVVFQETGTHPAHAVIGTN